MRWGVVVAMALGGCASSSASSGGAASPGSAMSPLVLEPSPLLELARGEREAMEGPRLTRSEPDSAAEDGEAGADETSEESEADAEVGEDDEVGEELEDDGEMVRTVRVKTSRFATPEDLARYALRHSEIRRPRELHPTRMLVRRSGLVRADGATRRERRKAASLVEDNRPEIKQCLVEEQTRRPHVLIGAPESLVMQQAARSPEPVAYRFSVHLRAGSSVTVTRHEGGLSAEGAECIAAVVEASSRGRRRTGRLEVPITAFIQSGLLLGEGGAMHQSLALEAATLGWVHYEREQYREALSYFRDAYWLFHLVEYQMLIGMALEQLGRDDAAADAYASYLERRPYAAEAPRLRRSIVRLRGED